MAWRLGGVNGLLICVIATTVPTAILMVLILSVSNTFKYHSWVKGMTKGVILVARVMIGVLAWDFISKSKKNLGINSTLIYTTLGFTVILIIKIHPSLFIIGLILFSLLSKSTSKQQNRHE